MTKFDITKFWYIGLIGGLAMMFVWPWFFILGVSKTSYAIYCGFGVMLFTFYLGNLSIHRPVKTFFSLRHKDNPWRRSNGNRTRWLHRRCRSALRRHRPNIPLLAENLRPRRLILFLHSTFLSCKAWSTFNTCYSRSLKIIFCRDPLRIIHYSRKKSFFSFRLFCLSSISFSKYEANSRNLTEILV